MAKLDKTEPDSVYDRIHRAIFENELRPGQKVSERLLAVQFGASPTPIREAILRLELDGLLSRNRIEGRGSQTSVTNLTRDELADRVKVRVVLESLAIEQAREFPAADLCEELRTLKGRIEKGEHDYDFHRLIWLRSRNRVLYATLRQLSAPIFAFANAIKHLIQDFHFGPGTVTGYTPAAPNTTSFRAEPCTSPPPVGARARPSAHRR